MYCSNPTQVTRPKPDPIFFLGEQFDADPDPRKVILGVGAYRDENGKVLFLLLLLIQPYVLPCVREAEKRLCCTQDHEYPSLIGIPAFYDAACKFAWGDKLYNEKKDVIANAQAISGSGSLRLLAQFLKNCNITGKVNFPNPTWTNQHTIFRNAGMPTGDYTDLSTESPVLDFKGMMDDINKADDHSCFVFHACAHNPTGVDPSHEQWDEISELCKKKNHIVLFDAAYLGYCSGSVAYDAYAFRKFVEDGHNVALTLSFSKNFGLYGERAGIVSIVTGSPKERENVVEQLKIGARALWSCPPLYGARIVTTVLNDPVLFKQWEGECAAMSQRIKDMRALLVENLKKCGSKRDWSHIVKQSGMFSYTGLTVPQIERLRTEFHVYILPSSRASVAAINPHNVEYIAKAMHEVTK